MRDFASVEMILHTMKSLLFHKLRNVLALLPAILPDYPVYLLRQLTVFDLRRPSATEAPPGFLGDLVEVWSFDDNRLLPLLPPITMVTGWIASDSSCTENMSN